MDAPYPPKRSLWRRHRDGRIAVVVFVNDGTGQLGYRFTNFEQSRGSGQMRKRINTVQMPKKRFFELFTAVEPVTTGDGARP